MLQFVAELTKYIRGMNVEGNWGIIFLDVVL